MSYTEQDIRNEAARQIREILEDPDALDVREMMESGKLRDLHDHNWIEASTAVEKAVRGSADLSSWAVEMGAEKLAPAKDEVTIRGGDGQAVIRLHFGFADDLSRDSQTEIITAVAQHLSNIL